MPEEPRLGESHTFRNGAERRDREWHWTIPSVTFSFGPPATAMLLPPYIVISYGDAAPAAWDRATVKKMGYDWTRKALLSAFVCGTKGLTWAQHGATHFTRIRIFARFEGSDDWLVVHNVGFQRLVDNIVAIRAEYDESLVVSIRPSTSDPNDTEVGDLIKVISVVMGCAMAFTLVAVYVDTE